MIIDRQKEAVIRVKDKMPKMPLFIMELWVRRAIEAGNVGDLEALYNDPSASTIDGGFIWANTAEGGCFWSLIMGECNSRIDDELRHIEQATSKYIDFQHIH